MNMTCKVAMDLSELYHAKLVSPESAQEIRAHLKNCDKCRKYYKDYEAIERQKTPVREQPAEDMESTEARLYLSLSKKLRRRRMFQFIGTSAAIGAGSIMLVAGIIMLSKSERLHAADLLR